MIEEKEESIPTFSLRSPEFYQSEFIKSRVKVHLLDEDYAWVPKRRDFTKVLNEEILENQGFRDREASCLCYYAQILPTFVYSYFCVLIISLGAIWTDNPVL